MHGPAIKQPDGKLKKTFLIAFIDDASRLITHAQFFWRDNTANVVDAFRTALYKRGKPERLYFDNGANYTSGEILQASMRLNIRLSHAPVRDGAAKGEDRPETGNTWTCFRSERRANGRPGWKPRPWMA